MKEFGSRFTRLGDIALIKRGITSGCDAFFMPRDVSAKMLAKHKTESEWQIAPLFRKCKRRDAESGKLKIIQAGDKTLHPIESEFVRPEVHTLMTVSRPRIAAKETDRVVLWTNKELDEMKGTLAHSYIVWGSRQTFKSTVRVPKLSTCESRQRWYDVTGLEPGIGFWPMAQKYRHIIPYNQDKIPCNHNLFDIHSLGLDKNEESAFMAILNSTLLAFFKHFYGRYAGAEGTLKTEVVDSLMMEIPSPMGVSLELSEKLGLALDRISERDVTHLLEEEFRICTDVAEMRVLEKNPIGLPLELQKPDRRELDLLVFEVLGVDSAERREKLVDQLYHETTKYYRALRIQDIQSSANRSQGSSRGASANSIAMGAWQQVDDDLKTPLTDWLAANVSNGKTVHLPEGEVRLPDAANMFENATLFVGRPNPMTIACESRVEAELLEKIASAGLRGDVIVSGTESDTKLLLADLVARFEYADDVFKAASEQHASDEKLQGQVKSLLHKWFIHGKFD